MSGRLILGGASNQPSAAGDKYASPDSISFSAQHIFNRSQPVQLFFDVLSLVVCGILISATAVGITAAIFICFFVRTI